MHHILSFKFISYLQKCFSYVIKQHKNDPVFTKASIQKIVPHCFGDHEKCDEKWCSENFDASYKHKLLPYARDLLGEEFKKDLNRIFEKHAKKCWCTFPKWKFLRQWIFQPSCCTKDTQNASLFKTREPQLLHCFSGLPKEQWPGLHDWCKYCHCFISRKKLAINSHHTKLKKNCLFIQKKTLTAERKQKDSWYSATAKRKSDIWKLCWFWKY